MKRKIRKKLKDKRKQLDNSEIIRKSKKIKEKLFDLEEFKNASTILFYVSYDNEVFTHDMIKKSMKLGKKVVVPVSDIENRSLILCRLNKWSDLSLGSYGILEPKKEKTKKVSLKEIDLIIVPGVGFDKKGRRIGHGLGYYDNCLKKCKNILKIGLSFECQIIDRIPTENHDISVDIVISENRVINRL